MKKGKHLVKKLVATMENEDLAIRDSLGDTPLHCAARFGNLDAAEILVTRNLIYQILLLLIVYIQSIMQLKMDTFPWMCLLTSCMSLRTLLLKLASMVDVVDYKFRLSFSYSGKSKTCDV
ncbi:hypothetical protein RND71_026319 [Anisodus tanguticus]|uniref:Uncharacterized protein n=1 Tax=Anisodus tanguticus TaxID=243964 RepID=A0AAE1RKQ4_9SOLA|nr:hypothetical protein RND71_026319 [Anisodus tanguticus]